MKYISTRNKLKEYSFGDAVIKGLADDGGLFFPKQIPVLNEKFFAAIEKKSFTDISFEVSRLFIDDIPNETLEGIIQEAINFPAPMVKLSDECSVLELFHGNTCAFKDFGARFLAGLLSHYLKEKKQKCTILVATSGDTGSAVASGFYGKENVDVILLYPSGKVSKIQEQQLTTFDKNITAFEVLGSFDDCQLLVKNAFMDTELNQKYFLSSANSINIGRLIPQSFYYFNAWKQVCNEYKDIAFVVPCGNLGNLTSGLLAKEMGLPVQYFVSALNKNDIFAHYIKTGEFSPIPSVKTISNAMDVGNPSNLERIRFLFNEDIAKIRSVIHPYSFDDSETQSAIQEAFANFDYVFEPHGAVGYLASKMDKDLTKSKSHYIILETAHPAKFLAEVENSEQMGVKMPGRLAAFLKKEKNTTIIENNYNSFRNELLKVLK